MLTALYISRAALGWGIVVLRWPLLGRAGTPRAFWVCMLSCAVGATLQIPFVYQQLVLFLGDDRYASVLLLSAGVAAAVGVRTVLVTFSGRAASAARWDWFAGAVACAVSSCALIGGHPSTSYVCVGTCGFVDATWRSWLHWLPVLGVYAWTMLSACVFCHRYRAACDLPALRKGLWLVGAGSALCLSWVGVRVAVLVAWHQGGVPTTWRSLDSWAEALIWTVSMSAVAVGALWEPLTRHVGTVAQDVRSLWRLHGLWRALVEVHPDVRLVRSSLTMRPRVRLVRRVVGDPRLPTRDRARREPASLSRCPNAPGGNRGRTWARSGRLGYCSDGQLCPDPGPRARRRRLPAACGRRTRFSLPREMAGGRGAPCPG